MRVVRIHDHEIGPWAISGDDEKLLDWGIETNQEAWKRLDRLMREVQSPAQKRSDYAWQKRLDND